MFKLSEVSIFNNLINQHEIMKPLKGIVSPYVISIYYTNFPPCLEYGV